MSAVIVADIVIAAAAGFGCTGTILAWIYRRGRTEGGLEKSMQDNTSAVVGLTTTVAGLNDKLMVGFDAVHTRIDAHDIEIAVAKRDIQHLNERVTVAGSVLRLPPE